MSSRPNAFSVAAVAAVDLGRVGDVAFQRNGAAARRFRNLLGAFAVYVEQRDMGALRCKPRRDPGAEAGSRAGDDGDFALQTHDFPSREPLRP